MLDIILEKLKQIVTSRLVPIALIFIILFGTLINRLFVLQIVQGKEHSKDVSLKRVKTRELKSARGNIYDKNGVLLAYNELTFAVVLEESTELSTNADRNTMLHKLITILEKHGNEIESEFGISIDENGELYFNVEGNAELRFKKNVYGRRSVDKLEEEEKNATVQEVFEHMRHGKYMFAISDEYSLEEALKIMTLRYAIYTNYPKYNQIIIASNVSDKTVAAIVENSKSLPGVEIKEQTYRKYNDSVYFAHILGYTGLVNAEELEKYKELNYNSSDFIGKSGIEKEFESYLAGTKGLENISVNNSNKYLETIDRLAPIAGDDIYLTIDSDLQKAIYHIIEKNLAGILLSKINNSMNAGTKGTSASDIRIPIYDVYYNLINNNVIDVNALKEKDATDLEKQVYNKFTTKQKDALHEIKSLLDYGNTSLYNSLTEEEKDYISYIYSELLVKGKIILSTSGGSSTSANGTNESVSYNYSNFEDNKFSFSQFLQHAIASNNIDLTKLNISDQYYNTEEIYEKLLEVLIDTLKNDSKFDKILYKSLVYSYKLSGTEICLLLFDQGVIKYNKEEKSNLENGVISAYSFITDKIRTLEITPAQLALDPCSASVVVTDVKTGEVLAMVSYPSYDNNMFANKVDAAYFNKLNNDLTGPQNHRATKQRTAPGSTFKMVSAAALLEEGAVGPSETILDKTIFDKIVPSPRDWTTHSHGKVDVTTALEVSCNYFFYEGSWRLGMDSTGKNNDQIGLEKLAKYAELFGFGEKSGIEVEEYDPHISDKYSVPSAIGQGTHNYTPVQIARYVTTVANSGKRFDLTLLDRIQDKDNNVLLDNKAKYTELTTIKDSTWDLIHEGMYKVGNGARSSTSKMFKDFGVTVAGKTGTAQESKSKPNHALFVSYAPYTAPEISVTTVIPNGHGSSNAVELTRDVYSYYFDLEDKDKLVNGFAELPETESRGFAD
ncbi:hypothetical protein GCM10023142_05760 [Anaerocolumna aminovalerica]|uniref:Penicillin-binding protein 2 n=1 Tax=Anaerocolumna aminovalerica TaxID=1527 RepID=A0A1I5CIR9_9FIRM|nr:penicillin-binding transpeptidase domain-containing protein [Anaerocolumna aminovalerica]MBU5332605.1 hypothetical protein [Anaerocolumna aminovalerica]MDU6264997.1 penicillin-binding transpeptidase domain-containing protein [Anaerocolumna aminovalerica]SFN86915.1 penicillin-binding protein 2 [Anaerocolumna aminovalerica]